MLDKTLTGFIWFWVVLVALLNTLAVGSEFYLHPFGEAWGTVTSWYSPFNLANFLVEVLSLTPAIGASLLRDKLRKKKTHSEGATQP